MNFTSVLGLLAPLAVVVLAACSEPEGVVLKPPQPPSTLEAPPGAEPLPSLEPPKQQSFSLGPPTAVLGTETPTPVPTPVPAATPGPSGPHTPTPVPLSIEFVARWTVLSNEPSVEQPYFGAEWPPTARATCTLPTGGATRYSSSDPTGR